MKRRGRFPAFLSFLRAAVCEVAESAEDETAYLLRSPANRERLLRAIENVAQGKDLVVIDPGDLP